MEPFLFIGAVLIVLVVAGFRLARRDSGEAERTRGPYDQADPNLLKSIGPPTPFRDAAGLSLPHHDNGPGPTPGIGGD